MFSKIRLIALGSASVMASLMLQRMAASWCSVGPIGELAMRSVNSWRRCRSWSARWRWPVMRLMASSWPRPFSMAFEQVVDLGVDAGKFGVDRREFSLIGGDLLGLLEQVGVNQCRVMVVGPVSGSSKVDLEIDAVA